MLLQVICFFLLWILRVQGQNPKVTFLSLLPVRGGLISHRVELQVNISEAFTLIKHLPQCKHLTDARHRQCLVFTQELSLLCDQLPEDRSNRLKRESQDSEFANDLVRSLPFIGNLFLSSDTKRLFKNQANLHKDMHSLEEQIERRYNATVDAMEKSDIMLSTGFQALVSEQDLLLADSLRFHHTIYVWQGIVAALHGELTPALYDLTSAEKLYISLTKAAPPSLAPLFKDAIDLYSLTITCARKETGLIIHMEVPYAQKRTWEAFSLESSLFWVQNRVATIAISHYVLVSATKKQFHTLTTEEWSQCQHSPAFGTACGWQHLRDARDSCAAALYQGEATNSSSCHINILPKRAIIHPTAKAVYVYHPSNTAVKIYCPNSDSRTIIFEGLRAFSNISCAFKGEGFFVMPQKTVSVANIETFNLAPFHRTNFTQPILEFFANFSHYALSDKDLRHLELHNFSAAAFKRTDAGQSFQYFATAIGKAGSFFTHMWAAAQTAFIVILLALVAVGMIILCFKIAANRRTGRNLTTLLPMNVFPSTQPPYTRMREPRSTTENSTD
jgi:hypothetical protein